MREPIAIIGIGCRFAEADGPDELWELLITGKNAIGPIPPDRMEKLGGAHSYSKGELIFPAWGGFLKNLDQFDAGFFGLSPREAECLDPQQRLLLEVSWEALEDGGQVPTQLMGKDIGVYVGEWINDYEGLLFERPGQVDFHMTTGSGRYAASGRVSHFLGLHGPSMTVDTACSSSLVAVHLACQALWNGECKIALAGGANTILRPHISIAYARSTMLSPDGSCKFGDDRANGFVRSEGAGIVVLKPWRQACQDHDPVYALIRGSAVNNDGCRDGSLGTPDIDGQADLLDKAYAAAGVAPGQLGYIEAHGTGTRVGDPVEVKALGRVLSCGRLSDQPCLVGSIKTNIGHTEGAAGVAGLIKVALSLKHRLIPGTLHFETPNPEIPWDQIPIIIDAKARFWPEINGTRLAGVSAFGISGTNAHVVLEQTPVPAEVHANDRPLSDCRLRADDFLLPISAHSQKALQELAERYRERLKTSPFSDLEKLYDFCASACLRKAQHEYRLAITGRTASELAEKLIFFGSNEASPGLMTGNASSRSPRVVFVFPGQGWQWPGMVSSLLRTESRFTRSMKDCDQALQVHLGRSLVQILQADPESPELEQIDLLQPALFAIQVSLAALWRSWGIVPDAVIGHSLGEVAACYVAGCLTLEEAAHIICERSRLMRRTSGQGAMLMAELTRAEAEQKVRGIEDQISVAVSNSERSTVLSGDPQILARLAADLENENRFCRWVKVDVASHSPQMEPLRPELTKRLEKLNPSKCDIPIYSTVMGGLLEGDRFDAAYWGRNLRQPVLFADALARILSDGFSGFLEMSAHPTLLPAIQQELSRYGGPGFGLPSMRREELPADVLWESLAGLFVQGYAVPWDRFYSINRSFCPQPRFPWQKERHWYLTGATSGGRSLNRSYNADSTHPFIARVSASAADPDTCFAEVDLDLEHFPFLADHRVGNTVVFPAAAFLEMALAASAHLWGKPFPAISQVEFKEAFSLSLQTQRLQLVLKPSADGAILFEFYSHPVLSEQPLADWQFHARGRLEQKGFSENGSYPAPPPRKESLSAIHLLDKEVHYLRMKEYGLNYGPAFQGVRSFASRENSAIGHLEMPESLRENGSAFWVHPVLLDACFQLMMETLPPVRNELAIDSVFLPVGIRSFRFHRCPDATSELWGEAALSPGAGKPNLWEGNVRLFSSEGEVLLEAIGLQLKQIEPDLNHCLNSWLMQPRWENRLLQPQPSSHEESGDWVIFSDRYGIGSWLQLQLKNRGLEPLILFRGSELVRFGLRQYEVNPLNPLHIQKVIQEQLLPREGRGGNVIYLWGIDENSPDDEPLGVLATETGLSLVYWVQELLKSALHPIPRHWLVTANSQSVGLEKQPLSIRQSPLWGLGRVLAVEHPELSCRCIDLSADPDEQELMRLWQELTVPGAEDQVALRDSDRFVARLAPYSLPVETTDESAASQNGRQARPGENYTLSVPSPGILDHLSFSPCARPEPGAGEVEIEVCAAGLNFLDVLKAMGICPGIDPSLPVHLGGECAGRISAVGEGASPFFVGDEVFAATSGFDKITMLGAYVILPVRCVFAKPRHLTLEQAAGLPIVYLTAHYALKRLGRLQPGERVLIHAAAGGVGLAAVQIARSIGAEIFATAGNEEKRDYLRSLGIDHVMDSRSVSFYEEIMERTHGEGVDVVLNSLSGDAIPRSLASLRSYGRFLEIGKRDIYQNSRIGLEPFRRNLLFAAIDIAKAITECPVLIQELLAEMMPLFYSGTYQPLPVQVFAAEHVQNAFYFMAQARQIGKVVVNFKGFSPRLASLGGLAKIDSESSYLITGGLGALGLRLAEWLASQGARHMVLAGRSGPSDQAESVLRKLRNRGVTIQCCKIDVTQSSQIDKLLIPLLNQIPPLKGIFHLAGVLADSTILNMDKDHWQSALAPKLAAWNLHQLSLSHSLDYFVLFSSVATLIGSAGQSNYAAGNAFLDALAHYRHRQSLPALSINWGPWTEVGLASMDANRGQRLAQQGIMGISPRLGVEIFERLVKLPSVQVAVMPFHWERWKSGKAALSPYWEYWQSQSAAKGQTLAGGKGQLIDQLERAESASQRSELLESHVVELVSQVLKLAPTRIDIQKPLKTMGLDSLMGLELRNRLEASLGLALSATLVWNYPTIISLTEHLLSLLHCAERPATSHDLQQHPTLEKDTDFAQLLDEIERLSDEEIRRQISE